MKDDKRNKYNSFKKAQKGNKCSVICENNLLPEISHKKNSNFQGHGCGKNRKSNQNIMMRSEKAREEQKMKSLRRLLHFGIRDANVNEERLRGKDQ